MLRRSKNPPAIQAPRAALKLSAESGCVLSPTAPGLVALALAMNDVLDMKHLRQGPTPNTGRARQRSDPRIRVGPPHDQAAHGARDTDAQPENEPRASALPDMKKIEKDTQNAAAPKPFDCQAGPACALQRSSPQPSTPRTTTDGSAGYASARSHTASTAGRAAFSPCCQPPAQGTSRPARRPRSQRCHAQRPRSYAQSATH